MFQPSGLCQGFPVRVRHKVPPLIYGNYIVPVPVGGYIDNDELSAVSHRVC